jgi:hypothetical protein
MYFKENNEVPDKLLCNAVYVGTKNESRKCLFIREVSVSALRKL